MSAYSFNGCISFILELINPNSLQNSRRNNLPRSKKGTPTACTQILGVSATGEAKDKNFVFSPCSIQLAISLIANGAKGSTLQELLKFLELENKDELKSHASSLVSCLTESNSKESKLSFVGGIWVDQSMKLVAKFKKDAGKIFKAKAEVFDFKKKAKEMRETVNQWAADSTNGLIDSLLPENAINKFTKVVLANALYFKGNWLNPFEEELTGDCTFHLLQGESVEVPFMSNYSRTQCIEVFDDLKVLRLPYEKSSLSMYILLPDARDGLWHLVEKICSDPKFVQKHTSFSSRVHVGIFEVPKFKIDYKFEALEVLQAMGLESCFSHNAEFGDIVVGGGIKVGKVYHGSHIEIEEKGTRAATSTSVLMQVCDMMDSPSPPKDVVDFVADHPFLYVVSDDQNGMILFMGYVLNPLLK